jgi:hypothetical protein
LIFIMWDLLNQAWELIGATLDKEHYSKPHVIEKKNNPRAASYASR